MTASGQLESTPSGPDRVGDCILPLKESQCSELVTKYGPMVKAACCRLLRDPALAEDIAQETFVRLVRKLPSLQRETLLGGWLYITACHLARTQMRAEARRRQRETQAEAITNLMHPVDDNLWRDLQPLLDDAMLTLTERQRALVLCRYFQNQTQRIAASLVGCSESVASRELAAAVDKLRRFFDRRGVAVSAIALVALLTAHGAEASVGVAGLAGTMSSASALAEAAIISGSSFILTFMKATTITKVLAGAAAILAISGAVYRFRNTQPGNVQTANPEQQASSLASKSEKGQPGQNNLAIGATPASPTPRQTSAAQKSPVVYDEAARKEARDRQKRFMERLGQLALMDDPQRIQELLAGEYGIRLSDVEVSEMKSRGPKGFTMGVIELWGTKQPQEALSWAAGSLSDPGRGWDLQQSLLEAAQKGLPNLNRDTLESMLPDGPSKARMLDLEEARANPQSLADRIMSLTDPAERAGRLLQLAQGWPDTQAAVEWAKQNLNGTEKTAFYGQISYNLAEQHPQTALEVLAELKDTDSYASTFSSMMRGLVQENRLGAEAAQLIANSNLSSDQRADLISELSRRWVRSDPDAAVNWVNTLTSPQDFRAAIPLLVSQLDNDRVSRTVEAFLKNTDPVMESALIEAAAPESLMFSPEKSRLILDPLITSDPGTKLKAGEGNGTTREEMLWNAVNLTAKRQAEQGSPAAALDWLASLPFASTADYSRSVSTVFGVWNIRSPAEAADWVQNSSLASTVKSDLLKSAQP